MKISSKTLFALTFGFLLFLALIDKFIIQKKLPVIYHIAGFKLDIKFWSGEINIPGLSIITFLVVPLFILVLVLIPYKSIRKRNSWISFWREFKSIILSAFWIPALILIGALIYVIFKSVLPESLKGIAEALTFSIKIFIASSQIVKLDFGLVGIIGLLIGVFLWYQKGFKTLR
ncbi:MAG: hypothetical protein NTW16_12015 [Bacteroidetes bacterium]|nr:hypothetical protein [Bacteroidota bacterium]